MSSQAVLEALSQRLLRSQWIEYELWLRKHMPLGDISSTRRIRPPFFSKTFFTRPRFVTVVCAWDQRHITSLALTLLSLSAQQGEFGKHRVALMAPEDMLDILTALYGQGPVNLKWSVREGGLGFSSRDISKILSIHGEYYVFMNAGDVAHPWMLAEFNETLNRKGLDCLFSDHDLLSEQGLRYMHVFKPGWSPAFFLSMDYVMHSWCMSRRLLSTMKGAVEHAPLAIGDALLPFIFNPGIKAGHLPGPFLCVDEKNARQWEDTTARLKREDLSRKLVLEILHKRLEHCYIEIKKILNIHSGLYAFSLEGQPGGEIELYQWQTPEELVQALGRPEAREGRNLPEYMIFMKKGLKPSKKALSSLVAGLELPGTAITYGQVRSGQNFFEAGVSASRACGLLPLWRGHRVSTTGYIGTPHAMRDTLLFYPFCFALKREFLKTLRKPTIALWTELVRHVIQSQMRCTYCPQAVFHADGPACDEIKRIEASSVESRDIIEILQSMDEIPFQNKYMEHHAGDMGLCITDDCHLQDDQG